MKVERNRLTKYRLFERARCRIIFLTVAGSSFQSVTNSRNSASMDAKSRQFRMPPCKWRNLAGKINRAHSGYTKWLYLFPLHTGNVRRCASFLPCNTVKQCQIKLMDV